MRMGRVAWTGLPGIDFRDRPDPVGWAGGATTLADPAGAGDDSIVGTDGDDRLEGLAGHDTLDGREGNDSLDGGDGHDSLIGGPGDDQIFGGPGRDTLLGGGGSDALFDGGGLAEADRLAGGAGNDDLVATGGGSDRLDGGDGDDSVREEGDYGLERTLSSDTLLGGAGNDVLAASYGADLLDGGDGQDRLTWFGSLDDPQSHAVTLLGGAGNDTLWASGGVARYEGGDGDDRLELYGAGAKTVLTGAGRDTLVPLLAEIDVTVTDFAAGPGGDRIDAGEMLRWANLAGAYSGGNPFDPAVGVLRLAASAADTRVQYDVDGPAGAAGWVTLMRLQNVAPAALTTDNFVGGFAPGSGDPPGQTLTGSDGADILSGGYGGDLIDGAGGDDYLFGSYGSDTLLGGDGGDIIDGGAGDDRLIAGVPNTQLSFATALQGVVVDLAAGTATGEGDDTLVGAFTHVEGSALGDTLVGAAGSQRLSGGDGDDLLVDTVGGADSMYGNAGNDTVRVVGATGAGTFVWVDLGDGDDSLEAGARVSANAGAGNDTVVGAEDALSLSGGAGDDELRIVPGTTGNVSAQLYGNDGDDTLVAEGDVVAIWGGAGNDSLEAQGNGRLFGDAGDDRLVGGSGRVTLDGGDGRDSYVAGSGATVAVLARSLAVSVDTSRDYVDEDVGGDVLSGRFAGFVTGAGNDTLVGSDGDDFFQSGAGDDQLGGGAGADSLWGQAGADTMVGGAGDDFFRVDNPGDVVVEAPGEGLDRVHVTVVRYALPENVETLVFTERWDALDFFGWGHAGDNRIQAGYGDDRLFGAAGDDTLVGFRGNDLLDGGGGIDSMVGGGGNDVYAVNRRDDIVVEVADQGVDTVQSSVSYSLPDGVENLVLTGAAVAAGRGNGLANALRGNEAPNVLHGEGGADVLDGRGGADTLLGGPGDDTYVVADADDRIVEQAGGGIDLVLASVSVALPAHVERLELRGAGPADGDGNVADNSLWGNDAANRLRGGDGADTLVGAGGADTLLGGRGNDRLVDGGGNDMLQGGDGNDSLESWSGRDTLYGGDGDDVYTVDSAGAVVAESADAGRDLVVSYVPFTLGAHLEDLRLIGSGSRVGIGNDRGNRIDGSSSDDELRGGGGSDTLDGSGGNDRLFGGEGRDQLRTGSGSDTLKGGPGADLFTITTDGGRDQIVDFAPGSDALRLEARLFGDRDDLVEGAVVVAGGGFAPTAELVIVRGGYAGAPAAVADGEVIGDASAGYRVGATVLFVVDNGTATGLFRFQAADTDARVEARELSYIGLLSGVPSLGLSDFLLTPQQVDAWWG